MVERPLMVRRLVRSFPHGGTIELRLSSRYNKGRGVCYPVCGMVHIKDALLLFENSNGGSGFPRSLSEWSFTTSDAI